MPSDFIKQLRADVGITDDALAVCARMAYDLLGAGRPAEAEVIARGLVAADDLKSYHWNLLGTALLNKSQVVDALATVDEGLRRLPGDPELARLRETVTQRAGSLAP
jgi:hypothetical protein